MLRSLKWLQGGRAFEFSSLSITCVSAVVGFWFSITRNAYSPDEITHLQIVCRLIDGDVLYRDIFTHVTPLSYYLTIPVVWVLGSQLLTIKLINTLIFAGYVMIAIRMVTVLTSSKKAYPLITAIILLAYAAPGDIGAGAVYSSLSVLLFLSACYLVIIWRSTIADSVITKNGNEKRRLAVLGALVGLCFLVKQNVGLLTLFPVILSEIVFDYPNGYRRMARNIAYITCSFLAIAGVGICFIWISGSADKFWEYTVLSQTVYVGVASISYIGGIEAFVEKAIAVSESWRAIRQVGVQLPFLLGPAAIISYAISYNYVDRMKRRQHIAILGFLLSSQLLMFPRADLSHVNLTLPIVAVCSVSAWSHIGARINPLFTNLNRTMLIFCIGVWLMFLVGDLRFFISGKLHVSSLPHFRGLMVSKYWHDAMSNLILEIKESANEREILILSQDCAFLYLAGNIKNPTPFDWYMINAYGRNGQQYVIDKLDDRSIDGVLIQPSSPSPLSPLYLERRVLNQSSSIIDLSHIAPGYYYVIP